MDHSGSPWRVGGPQILTVEADIRSKRLNWRRVPSKYQLDMGKSVLKDRETQFGKSGRRETKPSALALSGALLLVLEKPGKVV